MGATPDGTVEDEIIVEDKCPKRAEKSLHELAAKPLGGRSSSSFFLDEKLLLKTSHPWYTQVQRQLACTGAKFCDFFVWTPNEVSCQRIAAYKGFMLDRLQKVKAFYTVYRTRERRS